VRQSDGDDEECVPVYVHCCLACIGLSISGYLVLCLVNEEGYGVSCSMSLLDK
jgi:hypothetical protein